MPLLMSFNSSSLIPVSILFNISKNLFLSFITLLPKSLWIVLIASLISSSLYPLSIASQIIFISSPSLHEIAKLI